MMCNEFCIKRNDKNIVVHFLILETCSKMQFAGSGDSCRLNTNPTLVQFPFDYNFELRRLSWNIDNIDENVRVALASHNIPNPHNQIFETFLQSTGDGSVISCDNYSTDLLTKFCPFFPSGWFAARASADGNCLFNAASLLVTGKSK
jgi:hypothetical protein